MYVFPWPVLPGLPHLGTCQLDAGDFGRGVKNIEAALAKEPDNFDGSATRRLASGPSCAVAAAAGASQKGRRQCHGEEDGYGNQEDRNDFTLRVR